jgi:hemoglobin
MTTTESVPRDTVYERIGGATIVAAAVDLFYRKVLGDDRINQHFAEVNIARLKVHQRALITAIAGGPATYAGRSMRDAHAHLPITDEQFDVMIGHLVDTLRELAVPQPEIDELLPPILEMRADIVP